MFHFFYHRNNYYQPASSPQNGNKVCAYVRKIAVNILDNNIIFIYCILFGTNFIAVNHNIIVLQLVARVKPSHVSGN